jgi:putative hemolysin
MPMKKRLEYFLLILMISLISFTIVAGCTQQSTGSGPAASPSAAGTTPSVTTTASALANPAAVFCREKNYQYEIRKNPDGSEYGVCIFPNGWECEEWAFYRGTCNETTGK